MNSTPAEFEEAFSAVSIAAKTIGFVSQNVAASNLADLWLYYHRKDLVPDHPAGAS
jgi:hypothetical protein